MTMTDTIKHHLTPELLMAYSAGTLPEAFSLIVATHISMCDACRAELESLNAIGGALVEDGAKAELSSDSLEATMQLIASQSDTTQPRAKHEAGTLPAPLQDYVGGDLAAIKWRSIGMGVKQAILPTSKEM